MKKVLFFVMTLVASAFIVPNAFAAAPQYYENFAGGKEIFFANGTEITISERTDSVEGALITWDGGQQLVTANVAVFGGSHNSDVEVNASITMNGGTVKNIFGGGLHKSKVGTVEITLNDGVVKGSIMGGGYDGYVWGSNENCSCANTNTLEKVKDSTVRVEEVLITVNGGSVYMIYGGGGGYNYVGSASVIISALDKKASYVTAGGSNGYTGTAEVLVTGGEIAVLQGVNRGEMEEISMMIQGGVIENVYAGGESGDASVDGTFEESLVMLGESITGNGAEIGSISTGTNGGKTAAAAETTKLAYEEELYSEELFENSGFADENINTMITLRFIGSLQNVGDLITIPVSVPKGTKFTEEEVQELLDAVNEQLGEAEIEFKGFFTNEKFDVEYDFTKSIDEDTDVYMLFAEKGAAEEDAPAETPAEKNPETSDINMMALIIALLIGGTGLAFTIKNRKFN